MKELIGQSFDRYRLDALLGEGGMGAVFRARDITLQRDVALKVMHPQFAGRAEFRERFLLEARSAARLDHPGIVKVHDFGQSGSHLYIVMEFLAGSNLRKLLEDLRSRQEWILLPEALQLVQQVSLALHYAHGQGVLHRDIKPDNVMLKPRPEGVPSYQPVITDLGLARLAEGGHLTADGTSLGTPAYMSPEQARGESVDARSDVYSLGILLYELAVGRLPFQVRTLTEAIRCHTQEAPPPPRRLRPDLPESLEAVILKALAKDPAGRYPDARALATALDPVLPAATAVEAPVTAPAGAVSLLTRYQQSLVEERGRSLLEEFPPSPGEAGQDRIVVLDPDQPARSVALKQGSLTIGRTPDNDLVLDQPGVSRRHARVDFDGSQVRVTDLESTNGTFVANVRLLPGVPEVWMPDKPLRAGKFWLRLERAQAAAPAGVAMTRTDGTRMEAGQMPSGPTGGRIGAVLDTSDLSVAPGAAVSAGLTLLNQGAVVDHFQAAVEGIPPDWVTVPPPVQLMPGDQRSVTLIIQPPRAPQSRAGRYPLTFRAISQTNPREVAEVKCALSVSSYSQFTSGLRPEQVWAGHPAQVSVANAGNLRATFSLSWQDAASELSFDPPQAQLSVTEGETAAAEFRARPRRRRWIGRVKEHPFSAQVLPADGQAQVLSGRLRSRALLPPWVPVVALASVAVLILLLRLLILRPPRIETVWLEPAQPVAGQPVTLHWVVERADRLELRPLGITVDAGDGSYTFTHGLGDPTALEVIATNRFGSDRSPLSILVQRPTPTPTSEAAAPVIQAWSVSPSEVTEGGSVTIRWQVSGADSVTLQPFGTVDAAGEMSDTPRQTKTYTLIASNRGGTVQRAQEVVVATPVPGAPVVRAFSVEPASLVRGSVSTVRLTWDTSQADAVTISPSPGSVGPVGSTDVPAPDETTVYELVARGQGGETRSTARVEVTQPELPDLEIIEARYTMEGYTGGCIADYGPMVTTVCVRNAGAGQAGAFEVQVGSATQSIGGLAPGESQCVTLQGTDQSAAVDPSNAVGEQDEDNNSTWLPVPTAPPICTPTPNPGIGSFQTTFQESTETIYLAFGPTLGGQSICAVHGLQLGESDVGKNLVYYIRDLDASLPEGGGSAAALDLAFYRSLVGPVKVGDSVDLWNSPTAEVVVGPIDDPYAGLTWQVNQPGDYFFCLQAPVNSYYDSGARYNWAWFTVLLEGG